MLLAFRLTPRIYFINLYDHTIKPILLYGSEIWGTFDTNSASCKKTSDYIFEKVYASGITENPYYNQKHHKVNLLINY
jgi:hypothetical protein